METTQREGLLRRLMSSEARINRLSLALGLVAVLLLGGLMALGVVRQAQLLETVQASAESGRVVVQLQRETLKLLALIHKNPDDLNPDAIQRQREVLESRFFVVRQERIRAWLPPSILPRIEAIEEEWAQAQTELDAWQEDITDTEKQALLAARLQSLEVEMNQTEIEFQRVRVLNIANVARDAQQWLAALGVTSVLVIGLIGFMGHYLFQTTRNQQQAQAAAAAERESNRLKSEFLATMSHELRTPLNGVIGYADFLMTAMSSDLNPKQVDYLQRILSNGERLLRLVDDILDVSRIEAGRLTLVSAPYSPADLLENLKSELQNMTMTRGLALTVSADPDLPSQMLGDRQRLTQMVTNLTWNAVKFTEVGGITVNFKCSGDKHWSIIVTDTGIGIPAHAQEFIFEKFRQADGTTEREHGGAGLGLHIVRNLAVLMGGTVRVSSEVDKGSTFTIDLPIVTPELVKA
jgi:signal transduction histidine kinase